MHTASQIASYFAEKNFEHSRRFAGASYTPQNLKIFLQKLHNPQNDYNTFHIAGSVGKGSSAFFLARWLQKFYGHKEKIGLYISPHLQTLHERFQINGVPIDEKNLFALWQYLQAHDELSLLSYFDALTALAFLYFSRSKVKAAVIETGLGGRLDSTNVIEPLCTIFTPIGLDHQNILGNTLQEIAAEKAGILKTNAVAYSFAQKPAVKKVLQEQARLHNVKISFVAEAGYKELLREGNFLSANALVVEKICRDFFKSKISLPAFRRSEKEIALRGRVEKLAPNIWFDSAHNHEAILILTHWLLHHHKNRNWFLIFNFMRERDFVLLSKPLSRLKNKIHCRFFFYAPTQRAEGIFYTQQEIDELQKKGDLNFLPIEKIDSLAEFKKKATSEKKSAFLFFGSMRFYNLAKEFASLPNRR